MPKCFKIFEQSSRQCTYPLLNFTSEKQYPLFCILLNNNERHHQQPQPKYIQYIFYKSNTINFSTKKTVAMKKCIKNINSWCLLCSILFPSGALIHFHHHELQARGFLCKQDDEEYLCKEACLTNLHTKGFKCIAHYTHSIFYLLITNIGNKNCQQWQKPVHGSGFGWSLQLLLFDFFTPQYKKNDNKIVIVDLCLLMVF